MENVQIFCLDNSEYAQFEAENKGFRNDIFVEISNNLFKVNVYNNVRLSQDFEEEIIHRGFFCIDPNLIIVKEVNKKEIEFTIQKLFLNNFFNFLKPINKKDINSTLLQLR